jgi:hypothetical protein
VPEDELNTKVVAGHPRWETDRATHFVRRVCLELEGCILGWGGVPFGLQGADFVPLNTVM